MRKSGWNATAALAAAAMVWVSAPAPSARAEMGDSSVGAGVAIGLMATVVVVYGLVALRSDVERFTRNETESAIEQAARMAEESPVVLRALTAPIALDAGPGGGEEIAGASVGLRFSF